jgi:hypothetical protein
MANQSIEDLLKSYTSNKSGSSPEIASEGTKEKFEEKMEAFALK